MVGEVVSSGDDEELAQCAMDGPRGLRALGERCDLARTEPDCRPVVQLDLDIAVEDVERLVTGEGVAEARGSGGEHPGVQDAGPAGRCPEPGDPGVRVAIEDGVEAGERLVVRGVDAAALDQYCGHALGLLGSWECDTQSIGPSS